MSKLCKYCMQHVYVTAFSEAQLHCCMQDCSLYCCIYLHLCAYVTQKITSCGSLRLPYYVFKCVRFQVC